MLPPMLPPAVNGRGGTQVNHHFQKKQRLMVKSGSSWTSLEGTLVGETGIEPVTPGLEGRCSIQLSYSPVLRTLPSL